MCVFTANDKYDLSTHFFEFNRNRHSGTYGLWISNQDTGKSDYFPLNENKAYRVNENYLEVGTIDWTSCRRATDNMRWPVMANFLAIKGKDIIGIGDIRDGRYSFKFNLVSCPVQLGYDGKRITLTFECVKPSHCDPHQANYDPNPGFGAKKIKP